MPEITVRAYAKLNITLDVLGCRSDGYHDMKMLMQTVSLHDTVRLKTEIGEGMQVRTNLRYLPNNNKNIAVIAANCFFEQTGMHPVAMMIDIEKRIPVCAGMAGGSSDGAAVLRGLRDLYRPDLSDIQLAKMGEAVGSDVPYCVLGATMLAEGRGEILTPMAPMPHCHVVICKPAFSISTPVLFSLLDCKKITRHPDTSGVIACLEAGDLRGIARRMYNVFEDVLPPQYKDVGHIKRLLIELGALGAGMSGTGPTAFGLFEEQRLAQRAFFALKEMYPNTFLTELEK